MGYRFKAKIGDALFFSFFLRKNETGQWPSRFFVFVGLNGRGSHPRAPFVRDPFTVVRRGRACPARSLAVVSPLTVCIVGRGLDPSAAFRPTIVTGSSVGEGFIPPGVFAFPLASGPLPPTLSQLYHTLFPTPLQGVVKISLQIFLSFCVIIEKV